MIKGRKNFEIKKEKTLLYSLGYGANYWTYIKFDM